MSDYGVEIYAAATFGWLCVETVRPRTKINLLMQPPSGGCVLKLLLVLPLVVAKTAATFGWLCVETIKIDWKS